MRVLHYRRGEKVCALPECDDPMAGMRRDAAGHPHCMREVRRRRERRRAQASGVDGAMQASGVAEGGRKAARRRKRGPRPGVTVYFPSIEQARLVVVALEPFAGGGDLGAGVGALQAGLERRLKREPKGEVAA